MKTLLLMSLALFSLSSFAGHDHKGPKEMKEMMDKMSFEDLKKMKTEMLTKKATMITEARACVDASKTKDDLMKCHHEMKEEKKGMHAEMHDKMKAKAKK